MNDIWIVIAATSIGTYLIRFSFLGIIGNRPLPDWALLVLWPAATGGETDPARLLAALATLVVGIWTRSMLPAIAAGALVLYSANGFSPL